MKKMDNKCLRKRNILENNVKMDTFETMDTFWKIEEIYTNFERIRLLNRTQKAMHETIYSVHFTNMKGHINHRYAKQWLEWPSFTVPHKTFPPPTKEPLKVNDAKYANNKEMAKENVSPQRMVHILLCRAAQDWKMIG